MISIDLLKWMIDKQDESPTLEYKERLHLDTDGDKAQFVKDILSLANSGAITYLILGLEDGTKKLKGITESFKSEQLNEILKNKCDPAITVEYDEKDVYRYKIGVIEIHGVNPPYFVSVHDKLGGKLTENPNKECTISRGTVYIRRHNQNEGACRADVDRLFMAKLPQPYLQMTHTIKSKKFKEKVNNVELNFHVRNLGNAPAYYVFLWVIFKNALRIKPSPIGWTDNTSSNNGIPSASTVSDFPIIPQFISNIPSLNIEVDENVKELDAKITLAAINMNGVILLDPYKIAL